MLPSEENPQVDADLPLTPDRIPLDIPNDTKVPPWAYLDVTVCARLVRILAPSPRSAEGKQLQSYCRPSSCWYVSQRMPPLYPF